jgi:hypothetical protein
MNRYDAISKINDFAVHKTPFLFVTDFEGLNTAVLGMKEAEQNGVFFRIGPYGNTLPESSPARKFSFIA